MIETLQRVIVGSKHPHDFELLWNTRLAHLAKFNFPNQWQGDRQASFQLLQATYPTLQDLWTDEGITSDISTMLWLYWLPLAEAIAAQAKAKSRPMIQGILGGQGTGKTTLCKVLVLLLEQLGLQAQSLSIDDLYKTYAERQDLIQADPRLRWRGPPKTHDVQIGLEICQNLLQGAPEEPLQLPQFDKYAFEGQGDRTSPITVPKPDVLLFEGWFVGVRPISPEAFDNPPKPIQTEADQDFARTMNQALTEYLPLWDQLDSLLVLKPTDYHLSLDWRWDAEAKAIAQGKTGMSHAEITEFVQYFWKALHPALFTPPLIQNPDWVNYVMEINADHQPTKLYSPQT